LPEARALAVVRSVVTRARAALLIACALIPLAAGSEAGETA
jgi:hypothetical protein